MNRKYKVLIWIVLIFSVLIGLFYALKGKVEVRDIPVINNIANPASKNCTDLGGTLEIRKRGDQAEYGVCIFEDNRQCEEWSLMKNECPMGGVKITGYITEAGTYCAILGGKYEVTNNGQLEDGMCSFFGGKICNAWDLYNGKCEKGEVNPIIYNNDEFNFSLNIPRAWEGKCQVKEATDKNIRYISFVAGEPSIFKIAVVPSLQWEKEDKHVGEYLGRDTNNSFAFVYSTDAARSDKQLSDEYFQMILRIEEIKQTFRITKPYIFPEKSQEKGSNYTIDIMYPYVGGIENGRINMDMNVFVQEIVSRFKTEVSKEGAWSGQNTLKIFYDPYEINSKFVSIRFETNEYTGGATGANISYAFNYDLKKGKVILISDLLGDGYLKQISDKSIQYLMKVNSQDPFTNEEWIKGGAGPVEGNFKTFSFNKDTIVFYLNPDQVGPYSSGRQDIIFLLSTIKGMIKKEAVSYYGLKI